MGYLHGYVGCVDESLLDEPITAHEAHDSSSDTSATVIVPPEVVAIAPPAARRRRSTRIAAARSASVPLPTTVVSLPRRSSRLRRANSTMQK